MIDYWGLKYWQTGEWQVVAERLQDLKNKGQPYCPGARNLFRALRLVDSEKCSVILVGQDPYPDPLIATGLAFSIPPLVRQFPPTLHNLFKEYQTDTGFPLPSCGDLMPWVKQGVMLWNVIPSCLAFKSLSHDWTEYEPLTIELIQKASKNNVVFCFLGSVARRYSGYVTDECAVIETSHPSPRASRSSRLPFFGSRIFSSINAELVACGRTPINWRLP